MRYADIKLIPVDIDYYHMHYDGDLNHLTEILNQGYDIIRVLTYGRDNETLLVVVGRTPAAKELYEN